MTVDSQYQNENPDQITRSKNKLRAQIRELQDEVGALKEERRQWIAGEQERFEKRFKELEDATSAFIAAGLSLVKALQG